MTAFSLPHSAGIPTQARRYHAARLAPFFASALFAFFAGSAQAQPASPAQAGANDQPATYVGSETCQACHEDVFNAFQKNPHHLVETSAKYKFDTKACESCHGPGSKHAESTSPSDISNPAKLKPAAADKVCLSCHLNQPTNVGRITGSHAKNQVSCASCHSIHAKGPDGVAPHKAADVNQQCASCHGNVWASFQQPFRHKLPEGVMSCVDCHNPHGSFQPGNMQTSRGSEPGCLNCHADLAGPFAFQHAPLQTEGCSTCHVPHGTNNPRMLTRAQVQYVCLECHGNLPLPTASDVNGTIPPAIHDMRSPRFQNCTVCHQKIHGSNVDRGLFR